MEKKEEKFSYIRIVSKKLENCVGRPISSNEFQMVESWLRNHDLVYVIACIDYAKIKNAKYATFIDTIIVKNYDFYNCLVNANIDCMCTNEKKVVDQNVGDWLEN